MLWLVVTDGTMDAEGTDGGVGTVDEGIVAVVLWMGPMLDRVGGRKAV